MRSIVALSLAACAVCAQAQSFSADQRLAAPISMRAKIESLTEFTADLAKQTNVHFSVATAIADRKITAIFKDRPAKQVLQAVRDAMFMDWKKDGSGYLLVMSRDDQRDEEAALRADQEAIRSGLLTGIKKYAEAFSASDSDKKNKVKEFAAQISAARASSDPDAVDKLAELQQEQRIWRDSAGQAMASVYAGNAESAVDSLLEGHTVCASTRSDDGCPILPPDFLDKLNARGTGGPGGNRPPATAVLMLMNYNPVQQSLSGETVSTTGQENSGNTMSFYMTYHVNVSGSGADKTKLGLKLKAWQTDAEAAVMSKAIDVPAAPPAPAAAESPAGQAGARGRPNLGPGGKRFTLADHLEYLADHAGIPVIGDAFRTYCSVGSFGTETTVGAYMTDLAKPTPGQGSGAFAQFNTGAKNGWLWVRHGHYWQRLDREIPESLLRPMEQSVKEKGIPTIADYAKFAAGLTTAQTLPMVLSPRALAVEFDTFPFQPAFNSLRLFASFSEQQVEALEQDGLRFGALTPEQRQLFAQGLSASMWRGSLPSTMWKAVLSPRGLDFSDIQMKCRLSDYPMQSDSSAPVARINLIQEQAWFTYEGKSGPLFTEMYLVNKAFHR